MKIIILCLLTLAAHAQDQLLTYVQAYADCMIKHGRDTYGETHSPLFAVTLDRKTNKLPDEALLKHLRDFSRNDWGVRNHDRILTGANPGQDQSLLHICYVLSEITKNEGYSKEADASLLYFLQHCQGMTGLFAWGEHCGWDFITDKRATQDHKQDGTHEFCNNWELWERCFQLDPAATERFAKGLWEHQIADHKTGNFSRHAKIDRHEPGKDSQYPRHGGFYIRAWAAAYQHSKDPYYLNAITVLLGSYQNRRHPKTDAMLGETHKRGKQNSYWASSSVTLAVELHHCLDQVPESLAAKMRDCGKRTDNVYTSLAHDLSGRGGYVGNAKLDTLEPFVIRKPSKNPYSSLWTMAYGSSNSAGPAYKCLLRYEQTGDERYKKLGIDGAERYLNGEIDREQVLWPLTFGNLIGMLTKAYRISGDERYLKRANDFAQQAIGLFMDNSSPLPKASNKHKHYEAITGGPLFMLALLDLHCANKKIALKTPLPFDNR